MDFCVRVISSDGGVTGVSMLLEKTTGVPLSILLPLVNLPFIALAWKHLGRAFAIRSVLQLVVLAIALATIHYPGRHARPAPDCRFRRILYWCVSDFAVRGVPCWTVTEIAALIISKTQSDPEGRRCHSDLQHLFCFSQRWKCWAIEAALYSILTYVAAARTLDFVIHGIDAFHAITIISQIAVSRFVPGLQMPSVVAFTVYTGRGGKSGVVNGRSFYCVVTRLEVGKVSNIIRELDPDAFVTIHSLGYVPGRHRQSV
jgi:uncharacterized membrane-anchored protein YitT (DUF2179 family)